MKPLLGRVEMLAVVNTQYASLLSPSEYRVLMFIYQRTYGFNKASEVIPIRHFENGVTAKNGDIVTHGVGLKRRRILQVLQSLAEKQVVTVSEDNRRGNVYAINPMLAMMEAPMKRSKKPGNYRNPSAQNCTAAVHKNAPPSITSIYNRTFPSLTSLTRKSAGAGATSAGVPVPFGATPLPEKPGLAAAIAGATAKHHAAREARKAKLGASGIISLWYDNVKKYRPDLVGKADAIEFPKYTMTNIRQVISRGVELEKLPEFFEFVCSGWDQVCRLVFGNRSTLVGKAPDIRVVIKYVNEFYALFLKHADDKSFLSARAATPEQVERLKGTTLQLTSLVKAERQRAELATRQAGLLVQENARLKAQLRTASVTAAPTPKPLKSPVFTRLKGVASAKEPGQNLQTIAARLGLKPYE